MSNQGEKILEVARKILEESPKGIRYTDLIKSIIIALPDANIHTIIGTVWKFRLKIDKGEVDDILIPKKGFYIMKKFFDLEN